MSCHGFVKSSILIVILTCRNSLVPYDLSKGYFVIETEAGGLDSIPKTAKRKLMLIIEIRRRSF